MKRVFQIFIPLLLCTVIHIACAQDSKKEKKAAKKEAVRKIVEAKHYVFQAQSATPMRGIVRQLSLGYTLKVLPDTVICDLPFYGRAYQAPMSSSDTGIQFISSDFEYIMKNRKKGGWEINVKPKDVNSDPHLYLSISANGYTSLRVSSNTREPISFSGYIEELKNK